MAKRKRTSAAPATPEPAPAPAPVPAIAECPYTVEFRSGIKKTAAAAARKRAKLDVAANQEPLDQAPPADSDTVFRVRPEKAWGKLKRYRNFVGEYSGGGGRGRGADGRAV